MGIPDKFKNRNKNNRYNKYISDKSKIYDTSMIEGTVSKVYKNISRGEKSLVIYGQPQSGKTDMMIGLCAKIFDEGHDVIVVLVQSITLLAKQNQTRFAQSGINPGPKWYEDAMEPDYEIKKGKHLLFCTKENRHLNKLNEITRKIDKIIVIDDETDYATPNSTVNKGKKTPINFKMTTLVGKSGIFIGVTATPARNALNNTLDTNPNNWVYFPVHSKYFGYEFFFPDPMKANSYKFNCIFLGDESSNINVEVRNAFFDFLINVAFLNNTEEQPDNYIFLIHTSLKTEDHSKEKIVINKIIRSLSNQDDSDYERYVELLITLAKEKCEKYLSLNKSILSDDLVIYILDQITRTNLGVLNCTGKGDKTDRSQFTTDPLFPFTVVIGGNTISRGLTFNNMLSMYFSRDVKGKIGQATYIQRARMFGKREEKTLPHFTLTVPLTLYKRWWKCFDQYDLQLISARAGHPIFTQTSDNQVVPSSSIDKTTLEMDKSQMAFEIVTIEPELEELINQHENKKITNIGFLKGIAGLEKPLIPDYFLKRLINRAGNSEEAFAIHDPRVLIDDMGKNNDDYDLINLRRRKGGLLSGGRRSNYPKAYYHFWPIRNNRNKTRLWFFNKADEDRVTFMKSNRWKNSVVSSQ
jgi:hypothetical protein